MSKIYDRNPGYYSTRLLVDGFIRGSYRRIKYLGLEKIPKDGSVIYAPNHCDALMDPLAVLVMDPGRKVFVARADVFNNPKVARILHFFKIMPINRRRDGIRNMKKAEETIDKSIDVLKNRVPFCIMPEGTHRPRHGLLPIGKGVARIALGTYKAVEGRHPVYIVPIGLEYGDYFRFRGSLLAQVGDPINVSEFIDANPEMSEHDIMQEIRRMVTEELSKKIVCVTDEDNYDAIWELAKISSGKIPAYFMKRRLDANREAVAKLEAYRQNHPEEAAHLFDEALDFKQRRIKAKISLNSLYKRRPLAAALWNTILNVVTLPIFLVMATVSLPVWLVAETLIKKIKDRAFHNTARMGVCIVLWTILMIVYTVLLFCYLKWYWALLAVLAIIPAPLYTYDFFEMFRMTVSHWRSVMRMDITGTFKDLKRKLSQI